MSEPFHLDTEHRWVEQRDLIVEEVLRHLRVSDGQNLLDIGCGMGEFLEVLPKNIVKVGIDPNQKCVESARRHVPEARILQLKFQEYPVVYDAFDVVTAICVLEHVENPTALIRMAHRVCKPGGLGVFSTPNIGRPMRMGKAMAKKEKWERSGHRQGWDYHLLRHCLEYNGWTVEDIYTRFVDCPFYEYLPRKLGDLMSKRVLPRLFPRIGSELYAFARKPK